MHEIEVSIICNTYNQEKYIADALESFIMQKTNFKFEVLVHDDASTDNTPNIIKKYAEKYPDIIKPYYQSENQHSKKISITNDFQHSRAKGKYYAFCEGDDYWTDPLKLQKQYDILEQHPEIDMCAHGASCVNAETKKRLFDIVPSKENRIMTCEEIIMGEGGYIAANSMFYRRQLHENAPEFRRRFVYQYTLKILGSIRGGIYYIADIMSHYRSMADGSWTKHMSKNKEKWIDFNEKKNKMFALLDQETNYKYSYVIKERIQKNEFLLLIQLGRYKEALGKKHREHFKELSLRNQLNVILKAKLPWVLYLIGLLKRKR